MMSRCVAVVSVGSKSLRVCRSACSFLRASNFESKQISLDKFVSESETFADVNFFCVVMGGVTDQDKQSLKDAKVRMAPHVATKDQRYLFFSVDEETNEYVDYCAGEVLRKMTESLRSEASGFGSSSGSISGSECSDLSGKKLDTSVDASVDLSERVSKMFMNDEMCQGYRGFLKSLLVKVEETFLCKSEMPLVWEVEMLKSENDGSLTPDNSAGKTAASTPELSNDLNGSGIGSENSRISSPESFASKFTMKGFERVPVKANVLLTAPDNARSSRLVRFDISGTNMKYEVGDIMSIYAENGAADVERAAQLLNVSLDDCLLIKRSTVLNTHLSVTDEQLQVYQQIQDVRTLFTCALDIQGKASRAFLLSLSLCELLSQSVRDELRDLALTFTPNNPYQEKSKNKFSYLDVLEEYCSVEQDVISASVTKLKQPLPLSVFLSLIPVQRPRCYSVACSPLYMLGVVECNFVTVEYPTATGFMRGVSTSYMSDLKEDHMALISLKSGFRKIDLSGDELNFVGVALGSGLALLRSIIQHFYVLRKEQNKKAHMLLYLGVRNRDKDFVFSDELAFMEKEGVVTLRTAFSHDQPEFITPATLIDRAPEEVVEYLVDKVDTCKFLYCGLAGPAYNCIQQSIVDAIAKTRQEIDATQWIDSMRQKGRWEVQAFSPSLDPENPFA